jgi:glycosyltransferase involved in cell wall biosynthesis
MEVKPALSVVIAAFDAEGTLGTQLDALRSQECDFPWEVIVADNGSRDGTRAVVERWSRDWPQLHLVDAAADRGPAGARNIGATHAAGAALAFCDADDVVQPGWVEAMRKSLEASDLVSGESRRRHYNALQDAAPALRWAWYVMPFLPQLPAAGAGNMGISTSLFQRLGGFDRTLHVGEDLDLCWRAQLAGARIGIAHGATVVVSNRDSYAATFRQAFRYGRGNRQLRHNYANVIEAFANGRLTPVSAPALPNDVSPEQPGRARRLPRPADLNTVLRAVGTALGNRVGRIDTTVPRLPVPAEKA